MKAGEMVDICLLNTIPWTDIEPPASPCFDGHVCADVCVCVCVCVCDCAMCACMLKSRWTRASLIPPLGPTQARDEQTGKGFEPHQTT